jgi:hypothetical protein
MSARYYQVSFDASLQIIGVRDMGPAPVATRIVSVLANSQFDAEKRAKALIGADKSHEV